MPRVLARACGLGEDIVLLKTNWPFSLAPGMGDIGRGEARGEPGLLYSLIPSGNSLKSGQMTDTGGIVVDTLDTDTIKEKISGAE